MAKKKEPARSFRAQVRLVLYLEVPVAGNSFEDALVSAKALEARDCVDIKFDDGWIDSEMTLTGVNSNE